MIRASIGRRGRSWVVRWRPAGAGGVQKSRSFRSEVEARHFRGQLESGELDPFLRGRNVTTRQLADRYLEAVAAEVKPRTLELYRRALEHVCHYLGDLPAQDVRPDHLESVYRDLGQKGGAGGRTLAPQTQALVHRVARACFGRAERWELVKRNPVALARAPRVQHTGAPDAPTPQEVAALIRDTRERGSAIYPLVVLLAHTGLRISEALGLRVRDLDLAGDRPRLRVRCNVGDRGKGPVFLQATAKTDSSRREVELPAEAVEALRGQVARVRAWRLVLGDSWTTPADPARPERAVGPADDLVFPGTDPPGAPRRPRNASSELRKANQRAGLPSHYQPAHGLRHAHARMALAAGQPLDVVSKRLGHSSVAITADRYVRPDATRDRQAADAVAALLERADTSG